MLPSSGYFKNVLCPFFKNGLCDRHHCHFGHGKPASSSSSGRSVLGRVSSDVNKDFQDILDSEVLRSSSIEQTFLNDYGVIRGESYTDSDYVPTPVDRHVPKTSSILKKNKVEKYSLAAVPEYKPTPISRLKPFSIQDSPEENSHESLNTIGVSRKRKKVDEYDPTEVKCTFKKKVSFNVPEDDSDELPIKNIPLFIDIELSDDEEAGIIPQFSDDDCEEGDDSGSQVAEIKKEKVDDTNLDTSKHVVQNEKDDPSAADSSANDCVTQIKQEKADTYSDENTTTGDSSESSVHPLEVNDFSVVDKILVEAKKSKVLQEVHKPFKATLAHSNSDLKSQKSRKSLTKKNCQENSRGKEHIEKPKERNNVKSKQESCSNTISQPKPKGEKLLKDGTKPQVHKRENLSKHVSSNKHTNSAVCSNKPTEKKLNEKKNHIQGHKIKSASEVCSKEVQNKLQKPKAKSDLRGVEKKDQVTGKHSDLIKSESSLKSLERDPKNASKNKHKSSDKNSGKVIKTKESEKIQDEKVSSSCQTSNKKIGTSEKRRSSSPTKKNARLKSDVKMVVKSKSTDHKSLQDSVPSEPKMNSDKEIQCDVQLPVQEKHQSPSPAHASESDDDDNVDDVTFPVSDSDMDSDTYEECLRIFNEHEQNQAKKEKSVEEVKEEKKESIVTEGKKRIAYEMAVPKPKLPMPKPHINPSQVMHDRYLKLQEMYARQNVSNEKKVPSAFVNSTSKGIEIYKKRITVAPNAGLIAAVTQKQKQQSLGGNPSVSRKLSNDEITYVVTETKRIAHIPAQVLKPRPIIPVQYGCKVPSSVRQRYLNNFIDECLKFCSDQDEAYQTALDEEKKAYERSSNKTVYLNVAINTLKRLRDQAADACSATSLSAASQKSPPEQSTAAADAKMKNKTVSHEMMLGGARAQRTSFSIEKKKKPNMQDIEVKGKMLYECLMSYVLSTELLLENKYPLPHPAEPGKALVSGLNATKRLSMNAPYERVCIRCQKSYQVDDNGEYIKKEECEYHWGHLWQKRIGRSMERQYSCCGGDSQSDGCCVSAGHVFDGDESEILKGFVKTLPKTPPPDGYFGVYALDCEMCYTVAGIELIRVTVINPDLKPVYETFVMPENKILDYNTRFSGITEEHLHGVQTSLRDVQAVLLCLFNSKTVLIGHSLESDFKALKLIHTTVVDTAVVFPHKRGPPYKRALRTLMAEHLQKIIQNGLDGHDSNEDAVACMELMLWKIKEDMKRNR